MSQLNVDNIKNRTGSNGGPNFPSGITVAVGQTAYIHGNLQVDGTETIINTETLNVSDKTVGIGSTSNASNTTADGSGIEIFASSSQTGNNKTITWQNSSSAWTFGGGGIVATDSVVGSAVTINSSGIDVTGGIKASGIITASQFSGDGSQLSGIDATAIQTGNTSVQTVDTGSDGHVKMTTEGGERVRIGPAGQIGLGGANYGSSGQMLTSGGSGSAPTWTTVEAAPTVAGVANGAIATDKAVIVEDDGKLAEVLEQGVSAAQSAITPAPTPSFNKTQPLVLNCGTNKFITFWERSDYSNRLYGCVATIDPSTNAITYGSVQQIFNQLGVLNYDACYDSSTDCVFVITHSGQTGPDTVCIGMTITGTNIGQSGQRLNLGSNVSSVKCASNNNGGVLVLYHNGGTMYARAATMASNGALAWGNQSSSIAGGTYNGNHVMSAAYDSHKDVFGVAITNGGQDGKAVIMSINGTAVTVNSTNNLQGGFHYDGVETVYDPMRKQFLTTYRYTPNNYTKGISWYTDTAGTGIVVGTDFTITTNRFGSEKLTWSDTLDKAYLQFNNDTINQVSLVELTVSGTGQGTGFTNTMSSIFTTSPQSRGGVSAMNNGKIVSVTVNNSNVQTIMQQIAYSSTNLTTSNFLGFSKDSYTNGQTATVKINNNTTTTSGLSTNSVYYVQRDGTLGTTAANPSVLAGKALSSTSLIINLQQS